MSEPRRIRVRQNGSSEWVPVPDEWNDLPIVAVGQSQMWPGGSAAFVQLSNGEWCDERLFWTDPPQGPTPS